MNYTAPKEGAIAWLDGLSLLKAAKNVDQAYEFLFVVAPLLLRGGIGVPVNPIAIR